MFTDSFGGGSRKEDTDRLNVQYDQFYNDEALGVYLNKLFEKHGVSTREIIQRTGLDKGYFYRVLNGMRNPLRNQLILIALALGCDMEETQTLLHLGRRDALRAYHKRDAVIVYCIERRRSIDECQHFLEKFDLDLLR